MKTFKNYRNGNVRGENEKNANDVHLQRLRIVASLNPYFCCISVGKMRQCVDALGQRVKRVFTHLIHVHRRPAGASKTNYPVPSLSVTVLTA